MGCKTVLITTTINLPEVLRVYRAVGPEVAFVVSGDKKTPHDEVYNLCHELGNALYLSDTDQEKLGYESVRTIPWNCIMRRDIALLEALKLRPDVVVTIDDDNVPVEPWGYFSHFRNRVGQIHPGPVVTGMVDLLNGSGQLWFNVGDLAQPAIVHRGFPFWERPWGFEVAGGVGLKVGVVAGLWLGDPDINAAERMVNYPQVLGWSALADSGCIVEAGTWAPFNSQNTAYAGELAPLMAVLPHVGRYDDIWCSYIAQRIMWEHGWHVYYGPPFTWQERNRQSVLRNLKDEVYGMEHTVDFVGWLEGMKLSGSVVEMLGQVWREAQALDWLPQRLREFGLGWCRDVGGVL